ncbi:hypothetical protein Ahy_B08g093830 isoform A [Arachis hypogaea]|uniref:Uncharacterized protein n=1 Tax=Arachis hypogaea TaxID=3818 RepID=A0A444Y728_ARAHY|nr:hypothetical protein Ahy_B08g093830 isoform A [Arachis hypogaea]
MDPRRCSMEYAQDVSDYLNKVCSSDEVESFRNVISSFSSNNSMSSIEFSHGLGFSSLYNSNDIIGQTADKIAEVHCIKNEAVVNPANDQVHSISNESVDFSFDCIYDLEPLGFEKYSFVLKRYTSVSNLYELDDYSRVLRWNLKFER